VETISHYVRILKIFVQIGVICKSLHFEETARNSVDTQCVSAINNLFKGMQTAGINNVTDLIHSWVGDCGTSVCISLMGNGQRPVNCLGSGQVVPQQDDATIDCFLRRVFISRCWVAASGPSDDAVT
jgi:hypothetical protein